MNEQRIGSRASERMEQAVNPWLFVIDAVLIELGLLISSFGTALFYATNLGSAAMATFCDGLHLLLHISYGDANMLANAVFLVILLLVERRYINIGTILCVFTIGPWVNFFTAALGGLGLGGMAFPMRIGISFCGTALMGIGLGLYMAIGRGLGALEGIVKFIHTRMRISVRVVKIIQDAVLVGGGIFLGAAWGVGTLVSIVCTGPILQKSAQFFEEKVIKRLYMRFYSA